MCCCSRGDVADHLCACSYKISSTERADIAGKRVLVLTKDTTRRPLNVLARIEMADEVRVRPEEMTDIQIARQIAYVLICAAHREPDDPKAHELVRAIFPEDKDPAGYLKRLASSFGGVCDRDERRVLIEDEIQRREIADRIAVNDNDVPYCYGPLSVGGRATGLRASLHFPIWSAGPGASFFPRLWQVVMANRN